MTLLALSAALVGAWGFLQAAASSGVSAHSVPVSDGALGAMVGLIGLALAVVIGHHSQEV